MNDVAMKNLTRLFACLVAVSCGALVTGCQTVARRLEVAPVRQIIIGQTTMPEVEKKFGRPREKVTGANGTTVARYFFREPRINNHVDPYERREHPGDVIFRTLTLLYGPSPIIQRKVHDESVTAVRRYNGWYVAGASVLPENLGFMRKGETTKAELVDRLGEATSRSFDNDGAEMLVWVSFRGRRDSLANAEVRHLMVMLNEKLVVKDFAVVETDWGSWR
jgi:hypothetical protein